MMRRTKAELEAAEDFNQLSCEWDSDDEHHHRFRVAQSDGLIWIPDGGSWIRIPDRHAKTIAEFILEVLK
jgi:hypothetical protein